MEIKEYKDQLTKYAQLYTEWENAIRHFKEKYEIEKKLVTAQDMRKIQPAADKFISKMRAERDLPNEIYAFLDENYQVYLFASPRECQDVRLSIANQEYFDHLLFGYIYRTAERLYTTENVVWFERGLVAISLENIGFDFRDTITAIAELYVITEMKGVDPTPYIHQIASVSSQEEPTGGSTSLQETFLSFHTYEVLKSRRQKEMSVSLEWELEKRAKEEKSSKGGWGDFANRVSKLFRERRKR